MDSHMLDLLAALVRCPTENTPPVGREALGQAVLEAEYARLGLEVRRLCPASLPEYPSHPAFLPRDFTDREDLIGIWRGTGGGKSLLLTGHMDVVPKEPLPWVITGPYEPLIRDGRMYGRGTADMKAGLAVAAEAVRRLRLEGFAPRGDVLLESVVDEEYAGANGTVAARLAGYNADFGIVLEATGLNICPATVGGLVVELRVRGVAGMPYTGESIGNPAYDLAELVGLVKAFDDWRAEHAPKPALWRDTAQGSQVVITKLKAGEAFEHGQLSAPIDAWMEIVVQSYPGETEQDLLRQLDERVRRRYRDPDGLTITREYHYIKPCATPAEHPGVRQLARCAAPYTDRAVVCGGMLSCDMFELVELGRIPCALFGPVGARLHAPDEWVDLESMETCVKTLTDFIRAWCG